MKSLSFGLSLCFVAAVTPYACSAGGFQDPLERPALASRLAATSPLLAAARAGDALVAVGYRGHVVSTRDGGGTWSQAKVPVSSDLVGLHFPTASHGWAVGHDGVVLHSSDGGRSWTRQLDGHAASRIAVAHYEKLAREDGARDPRHAQALQDAKRLVDEGADKPFLDVWFKDASVGWVVGAFNTIFHTQDGGRSWTPWLDRTDNPDALHLRAIRGEGGRVFIVGERGLILRLDEQAQRFIVAGKPYAGTYFGVLMTPGRVIAYGLGGNAYASSDLGATWQKIETRTRSPLTGGVLLSDGRMVFVSQAGDVLQGGPAATTLEPVETRQRLPLYAVAQDRSGAVLMFGARGALAIKIPFPN